MRLQAVCVSFLLLTLSGHWGGIWSAPSQYDMMYTKNDQNDVTLVKKFDKWEYTDGVGKRLPYLYKNRLTTNHWANNPIDPDYNPGAITGNGWSSFPRDKFLFRRAYGIWDFLGIFRIFWECTGFSDLFTPLYMSDQINISVTKINMNIISLSDSIIRSV